MDRSCRMKHRPTTALSAVCMKTTGCVSLLTSTHIPDTTYKPPYTTAQIHQHTAEDITWKISVPSWNIDLWKREDAAHLIWLALKVWMWEKNTSNRRHASHKWALISEESAPTTQHTTTQHTKLLWNAQNSLIRILSSGSLLFLILYSVCVCVCTCFSSMFVCDEVGMASPSRKPNRVMSSWTAGEEPDPADESSSTPREREIRKGWARWEVRNGWKDKKTFSIIP